MEKNEAIIRRISFVALTYIRNYVRKKFSPIKITLNSIKKMLLQISKKIRNTIELQIIDI